MEQENKNNKSKNNIEYCVDIKSNSISIPKYCICCLAPTERMEIRKISDDYNKINLSTLKMPVCTTCSEKRKEIYLILKPKHEAYFNELHEKANRMAILIAIFSLTIPILVLIFLYIFKAGITLGIWLSLLLPSLIVLIAGKIIKLKRKVVNYSKYCLNETGEGDRFLQIKQVASSDFIFHFKNFKYANLFAKANNASVRENLILDCSDSEGSTINNNLFKSLRKPGYLWGFIIAASIIIAFIFGSSQPVDKTRKDLPVTEIVTESTPSSQPTTKSTPYNEPEIMFPANATKKYFSLDEPLAPFEIQTSGSEGYYYVVLANYYSEEKKVALYVHAGETVEINVPLGKYKLFYSSGPIWYGGNELFGPDCTYSSSDELLNFYDDGLYYNGCSITLYQVYDGNFDTKEIDKEDFPK